MAAKGRRVLRRAQRQAGGRWGMRSNAASIFKRWLKWSAALVVSVFGMSSVLADSVVPSDRVREWITIYAGPSAASERIGRLQVGESAELIRAVPFWYEIKTASGDTGYVSRSWSHQIDEVAALDVSLPARRKNEIRVHFVHTGPGACAVVECPGDGVAPLLIDCGKFGGDWTNTGLSADDAVAHAQSILSTYNEAPTVVVSHPDIDHYNLIPGILNERTASHLWLGGKTADYKKAGFQDWLQSQQDQGAHVHQNLPKNFHTDVPLGEHLSCGLADAYILTSNIDVSDGSKNNDSLVLMLEYGDFRVVFTGDAEGATEAQVIANYEPDIQASVLTGSHHGAKTLNSNSPAWAAATNPSVMVYTSGHKYQHPTCAAVKRFRGSLSEATAHRSMCDTTPTSRGAMTTLAEYMTEANGTVVITSNGRSPMKTHCSQAPGCTGQVAH